jgi:stage IV sporulation protein FB
MDIQQIKPLRFSFPIGRLFQTQLRMHGTFVVFLIWIAADQFSSGGWSRAAWGVGFVCLVFGCVVLHEFGHVLAARGFGIRTPDITLLPIGGVAHLERIPEAPGEEILVAIAGPMVSALLSLIFWSAYGFEPVNMQHQPESFMEVIGSLAAVNGGLLFFNLIPAFPMDGGRVLRGLLGFRIPHLEATRFAAAIGKLIALLMAGLGIAVPMPMLVLLGIFIYSSAKREAELAESRTAETVD